MQTHDAVSPSLGSALRSALGLAALLVAVAACSSDQGEHGEALAANEDTGSRTSLSPSSRPDAGPTTIVQGTDDAGTSSADPAGADPAGSGPAGSDPAGSDPASSDPSGDPAASDTDAGPSGDGDPPVAELDAGIALPEPIPEQTSGLTLTTTAEAQDLDLFGAAGHRFWMDVNPLQLTYMNAAAESSVPSDRYIPGVGPSFIDHLVIEDAATLSVADYGKVEAWLIGSSTRRPWTVATIPNVRLDANEFQKGLKIGDFEHIRLNNGLAGGIFRELLANRIYRALGYPAPRGTPVFLGNNVWGENVWVPMTAMEVYKRRFCKDNAELIGGGDTCLNMWEFVGDAGNGLDSLPADRCQLDECDDTRLEELGNAVAATPADAGFKQALDPYVAWDRFHQFQCLSWMMWTGDDAIHNLNNNLVIEREDGKLMWAPYSVDVSMGQSWHTNTPLPGYSRLARGCQVDAECWADTILECEILVDQFDALNPEFYLDEVLNELQTLGMLRDGDLEDAAELRDWLMTRQMDLPGQLEHFRYLQDRNGYCDGNRYACTDGTCSAHCD